MYIPYTDATRLFEFPPLRQPPPIIRDTNDDGRRLPLGVRLEDHIPEKYAEYANILKAIKFLGNVGSHKYDSVKIGDIEDAYDIMEFVTSSLYAGRRESIDALAARLEDRFK